MGIRREGYSERGGGGKNEREKGRKKATVRQLKIAETGDGHVKADDRLLFTLAYVRRKVFIQWEQTENLYSNKN